MISVPRAADHEHWAPAADVMAALMLIFMFVAVVYIRTVVDEESVFMPECRFVYERLEDEFRDDLRRWDAELLDDLAIRFSNVDVLFPSGRAEVTEAGGRIWADFFPRYLSALREIDDSDVREIRIEGHASTPWRGEFRAGTRSAYMSNMVLSQDRASNVLKYVMRLPQAGNAGGYGEWARSRIAAVGFSSSRLVRYDDGTENEPASQRVEFRSLVTACQRAGVQE